MITIAIVGRPNVGKSTLFNRLAGKKLALVDDMPGLTRDFREAPGRVGPFDFRLLDTPGLEEADGQVLEAGMRHQTEQALNQADLALFVVDSRSGITTQDRHFAEWIRRRNTPVILVANKSEGQRGTVAAYEAFELGLGEPIAFSAEHGEGMSELQDAIAPFFQDEGIFEDTEEGSRRIHLAIVGRPNAGKSTLVNALLGEDRALTSEIPGTTRDAIATDWTYGDHNFRLIDTAGMRRKSRIDDPIEQMAVGDTLRQIRLAQVVVLLMDAKAVFDKQDLTIARIVIEEGRVLIVAVNKWDEVDDPNVVIKRLRDRLDTSLQQVKGIETVTISALKQTRLDSLMEAIVRAYDIWDTRISTGRLNRFLETAVESHPPPLAKGRSQKLRYMTQIKARPPTFALWASQPDELPESYSRYIINGLRETFDIPGVPIRLMLRKSDNPFVNEG